ncbi:MAG: primase C-terminal domain-containing protein [Raineya sp.]|jgi:hypothetical protein|nr:primase C-terminal domain-containing protein [Raineya sp.]
MESLKSKQIFEGLLKALQIKKGKHFLEGNRNEFVFYLACACNRYGVPRDDFLQYALEMFQQQTYTEKEIVASTNSAYQNIHEHSKYTWK